MDVYEELREKIDIIEYVSRDIPDLEFDGKYYVAICPFHNENTPSFKINPENKRWKCWGCGKNGSIIDFVMFKNNLNFKEATEFLCSQYEIKTVEKPKIISYMKKYVEKEKQENNGRVYLIENAMDEFPESHEIIEWIEEGISIDVLSEHNVRYNKQKTEILFPIFDEKEDRKLISIKRRTLDPHWKEKKMSKYIYINKTGKKDFLYWWQPNLQYIKEKSECIIVESEKSVMKLETWGIRNSVAVGCHDLSDEQIETLIRCKFNNIVMAYDKDVKMEEIKEQMNTLRHYKNVYIICDNDGVLGEKDSPVDKGLGPWLKLYQNMEIL